jgi:hypothetical protein
LVRFDPQVELGMRTVTMQMDVVDLREQMNAMRAWLDDHRCKLGAFNCHQSGARVLVSVVFTLAADAKAFQSASAAN